VFFQIVSKALKIKKMPVWGCKLELRGKKTSTMTVKIGTVPLKTKKT
jgi:hypothetical protein